MRDTFDEFLADGAELIVKKGKGILKKGRSVCASGPLTDQNRPQGKWFVFDAGMLDPFMKLTGKSLGKKIVQEVFYQNGHVISSTHYVKPTLGSRLLRRKPILVREAFISSEGNKVVVEYNERNGRPYKSTTFFPDGSSEEVTVVYNGKDIVFNNPNRQSKRCERLRDYDEANHTYDRKSVYEEDPEKKIEEFYVNRVVDSVKTTYKKQKHLNIWRVSDLEQGLIYEWQQQPCGSYIGKKLKKDSSFIEYVYASNRRTWEGIPKEIFAHSDKTKIYQFMVGDLLHRKATDEKRQKVIKALRKVPTLRMKKEMRAFQQVNERVYGDK